jgi:PAS domain S-box-containing protein
MERAAAFVDRRPFDIVGAEAVLRTLAATYLVSAETPGLDLVNEHDRREAEESLVPILEARYRTLLEQMSAIVFMAYLDRGSGEAYVSPQIEASLGFSQQEWLEDPVRWYEQIHPDDKQRWSIEAAEMFLSGRPLRSVYRVVARDGRVVSFQCEARMVRRADGRPWFIQGVAFDVTDLKQAEAALREERNVLSAILETVGALVVVMDPEGRIARFNRACELTTGYASEEVEGRYTWDLFMVPEELASFRARFEELCRGRIPPDYETYWVTRRGVRRRIAWSSTVLSRDDGAPEYIIATGIDVTERRRLQQTILEISDQEERRIAQDLHDGLGQDLTGIAFMSKVLQERLDEQSLAEATDAQKILKLVNEAVSKTRKLARGLLPIVSDSHGLAAALRQIASDVEDVFRITCRFECETPMVVSDLSAATHLCHIAREAVHNAIKHGDAKTVVIRLDDSGGAGALIIRDDGTGFASGPRNDAGMGLHIMRYRANMIGGTLHVAPGGHGDTTVTCRFPLPSAVMRSER